jgi:hypothetical protein
METQRWSVVFWSSKARDWRRRRFDSLELCEAFFEKCSLRDSRSQSTNAAGWTMRSVTTPQMFDGSERLK